MPNTYQAPDVKQKMSLIEQVMNALGSSLLSATQPA